jgi:hypothetical protein
MKNGPQMNLYPQPSDGLSVTIGLDRVEEGQASMIIEIYDVTGKLVYTQTSTVNDDRLTVPMTFDNELQSGMYFITVSVDGRALSEKLVVE